MAHKKTVPKLADEWQVKDDLRTLICAEEIKQDSKRMDAVRKCAREQLADIAKITVLADSKPDVGEKY